MSQRFVTVTVGEGIAALSLANPPGNLLSTPLLVELDGLFGDLELRMDVRAVLLRGTGECFSRGTDIQELAGVDTEHQAKDLAGRGQALLNRIERFDKPVIAAVTGPCLGSGLELAMACHIRVAAAGAMLGLPETRFGLIPAFGGTQRLPRIIGPSKAAELILTGRLITAEEALGLGLITRIVSEGSVVEEAYALARAIASKGRLTIQAALRAIRTGLDSPMAEGLMREAELFGKLCETDENKEGLATLQQTGWPVHERS